MNEIAYQSVFAGWIAMLGGVVSGATIGLFFHAEDWMGGYASFRRRMLRLGHISFWGLGFVNVIFGVSAVAAGLPAANAQVASLGFILGAATMPLCCFLTAWRKQCRHLFPIPVVCVLVGVGSVLTGWGAK